MKVSRLIAALAITATVLFAPAKDARAGFLLTDGNAFLNGTQNYFANPGNTSNSQVDYAVYTVAGFQTSFSVVANGDPTKYVYAYQVLNDIGGGANVAVQHFSVGPVAGTVNALDTISSINIPANPNPLSTAFVSSFTSAKMDYTGILIPVGSESDIMYYTSSFLPGTRNGTVTPVGILPIQASVVAPIPEPTLVAVWAGLVASAVVSRRRWR